MKSDNLASIQEFSDEDIQNMCDIVSRQTNYTLEQIKDKLIEYNYIHTDIIKEYMGIQKTKPYVISTLNQEIYKQIRYKLDNATKDFNKMQYEKLQKELDDP
jgi:hypothetical protein